MGGDYWGDGWVIFISSDIHPQARVYLRNYPDGASVEIVGGNGGLTANEWQHMAVVREGTGTDQTHIYVNGIKKATGTNAYDISNPHPLEVGGTGAMANRDFTGYIDEVRISKGVARWSANFTPPIRPYYARTSAPASCPTGFIPVKGNPELDVDGFCVAKYEMKGSSGSISSTAAGAPYVSISATDAFSECSGMSEVGFESGTFALITNPQWMTIARDIELVASNWSGGSVGSGTLTRGWSAHTAFGDSWVNNAVAPSTGSNCLYNSGTDTCAASGNHLYKRTHTLINSEKIWDFSGNLWELVDWHNNDAVFTNTTASCSGSWNEFSTNCSGLADNEYKPANGYTSTHGVGKWIGGSGGTVIRGGYWRQGSHGGVFTILMSYTQSSSEEYVGFRCVWNPNPPG